MTTSTNPIALINVISEADATGDVANVYQEMQDAWQMVPNPMKLFSNTPELLRLRWEGFNIMGRHETIDAQFQTVLRMMVSEAHDCEYCVGLNEYMLINMFGMDADKVAAMKANPSAAPLCEKETALLLFTLKAVNHSKSTEKKDIDELHALGWNDSEIMFATSYAAEMVATDILINAFHVSRDY